MLAAGGLSTRRQSNTFTHKSNTCGHECSAPAAVNTRHSSCPSSSPHDEEGQSRFNNRGTTAAGASTFALRCAAFAVAAITVAFPLGGVVPLDSAMAAPTAAFSPDSAEAALAALDGAVGPNARHNATASNVAALSAPTSAATGVVSGSENSWSLYGFPFQRSVRRGPSSSAVAASRNKFRGQDEVEEDEDDEATKLEASAGESTSFFQTIWFVIIADTILCAFGALFAGLTLAVMGLDTLSLEIIASSGTEPDRTYARRILPLRRKGNQLLSTLVLGNVMVNTLIAQVTDSYAKGWVATAISTAIITIAAEIVPQALMTAHAMSIGSRSSPIVKLFMFLFYPICKPTAMFLDVVIGSDPGQIYNRNELKRLMMKHSAHSNESGVDGSDLDLMVGAIDLKNKTVLEVLTPIGDVFMIEANRRVNEELLQQISEKGHSRIPIYAGSRNNVIGVLHAKDLLLANPEDGTRIFDIAMFYQRKFHTVPSETKLYSMLRYFQTGASHIALVQEVVQPSAGGGASVEGAHHQIGDVVGGGGGGSGGDPYYVIKGVVTLEDVMEELLQREILDEHDVAAGLGPATTAAIPMMGGVTDPSGNLGMKVLVRRNMARTQRRIHLSSNQLTACALFLQRSLPEFRNVDAQLLATTIGLFSTVFKIRPPPDAAGLAWTDPSNVMLYGPTPANASSSPPSSPLLDPSAYAHCEAVMTLIISGRAEVSPCIAKKRGASAAASAYTYASASSASLNAAKTIVDDSVVAELLSWSLVNAAGMRQGAAAALAVAGQQQQQKVSTVVDYYCRVTHESLIMQVSSAQYAQIVASLGPAMVGASI